MHLHCWMIAIMLCFLVSVNYALDPYTCINNGVSGNVVYVTAFSQDGKGHNNETDYSEWSILHHFPDGHLIVYHDYYVPSTPGLCMFDLRSLDWVMDEVQNPNSGLNSFFEYAGIVEPMGPAMALHGTVKPGKALFYKTVALMLTVRQVPEGTLVVWVDPDLSFLAPLPLSVVDWLRARDVSFAPFVPANNFASAGWPLHSFNLFNLHESAVGTKLQRASWWRVDGSVLALTAGPKTGTLATRAVHMCRGGMLELARVCEVELTHGPGATAGVCSEHRVYSSLFLSDAHLWALLLQADASGDTHVFFTGLRQGWLASSGVAPYWVPNFLPAGAALGSTSTISPFTIKEFVHLGSGHSGGETLRTQVAAARYPGREWAATNSLLHRLQPRTFVFECDIFVEASERWLGFGMCDGQRVEDAAADFVVYHGAHDTTSVAGMNTDSVLVVVCDAANLRVPCDGAPASPVIGQIRMDFVGLESVFPVRAHPEYSAAFHAHCICTHITCVDADYWSLLAAVAAIIEPVHGQARASDSALVAPELQLHGADDSLVAPVLQLHGADDSLVAPVLQLHGADDSLVATVQTRDDEIPQTAVDRVCRELGLYVPVPGPVSLGDSPASTPGFTSSCRSVRQAFYARCRDVGNAPFLAMPNFAVGVGERHLKKPGDNAFSEATKEAVLRALLMGVRHLDSAENYGTDAELGAALREWVATNPTGLQREDVWVSYKLMGSLDDPVLACERAIEELDCGYLDLLLMHVPLRFALEEAGDIRRPPPPSELGPVWAAMEGLVRRGLVRQIGVSNFGVEELRELLALDSLTVRPAVNQVEFHLLLQEPELRSFCQTEGVRLGAFGVVFPLARLKSPLTMPLMEQLGRKYAVSEGALLVAHAQQLGYTPVVTASSTVRMSGFLPVLRGELVIEDADMAALSAAGAGQQVRSSLNSDFRVPGVFQMQLDTGDSFHFLPRPGLFYKELVKFCGALELDTASCTYVGNMYRDTVLMPFAHALFLRWGEDHQAHRTPAALLAQDGYFVLRGVVPAPTCAAMALAVKRYIADGGGSRRRRYNSQVETAGWYVADIRSDPDPALRDLFTAVHTHPRVRAALAEVFGGPEGYELVGRNELNVNRGVGYHRDIIEPYLYPAGEMLDNWAVLPGSDSYRIVLVGMYLEDLTPEDGVSLRVQVGSHLHPKARGPERTVYAAAGDIVVFDNRIMHRGAELDEVEAFISRQNASNTDPFARKHRILLSLGYGATGSIFTNAFKDALDTRNALFNDMALCNGRPEDVACAVRYVQSKPRV